MKELYLDKNGFGFEHDIYNDVREIVYATSKPEDVIAYLKASHWRFEHELIPRIEQNFLGLIKLTPNSKSLPIILNLFMKFQVSLKVHMDVEERITFPAFLNNSIPAKSANENSHSHEDQEPFLSEIIALLKKSKYASNPFCQLLIQRIENFDLELKKHAWIEEKIINS
ncbi:MAG: hypothetical protein MK105_13185 [Crocinitomicaceae bacterium]|nr:hypothetical protein [Crocinitomicaceae bacterium]